MLIKDHGMSSPVGIDAGTTLWKLVSGTSDFEMKVVPAGDFAAVQRRLDRWKAHRVFVTGSGADGIATKLGGYSTSIVPEFEAWIHGARLLGKRASQILPKRHLLVSIGTGTFVLRVDAHRGTPEGGTPIGGGTAMGMARLLRLATSFESLVSLANAGKRIGVDLLVRDVYGTRGPLDPRFTLSCFGKLQSQDPPDLACALMGLIGESVGILCGQIATATSIKAVVFGGSTLNGNRTLRKVLLDSMRRRVQQVSFLRHGAFCGAVGAAFWGR